MNKPTLATVWNCPTAKSVLASAKKVVDFLRNDYGIPAETAPSHLPNHLAIAVPEHHARRASHVCEVRFGRAF